MWNIVVLSKNPFILDIPYSPNIPVHIYVMIAIIVVNIVTGIVFMNNIILGCSGYSHVWKDIPYYIPILCDLPILCEKSMYCGYSIYCEILLFHTPMCCGCSIFHHIPIHMYVMIAFLINIVMLWHSGYIPILCDLPMYCLGGYYVVLYYRY